MTEEASEHSPELWPEQRAHAYANHLEVTFSLSEIELCFAQAFDAEGRAAPKCWVQTTPVHLVGFGRAINRTIAHYESRYGQIPDAAGHQPQPGS